MHALEQLYKDNMDRSNTRYDILTPKEAEWIVQAVMNDIPVDK